MTDLTPPPAPLSREQQQIVQAAIDASLVPIHRRLDLGAAKMDAQGSSIDLMRRELALNTATTEQVRDLLDVGRSGLRVLGWLGAVARWLGYVASGIAAVWAAIYAITHGGHLPPK